MVLCKKLILYKASFRNTKIVIDRNNWDGKGILVTTFEIVDLLTCY